MGDSDTESRKYDDEKKYRGCGDCSLGCGCCFWTHSCQLCCGCLPSINRKFNVHMFAMKIELFGSFFPKNSFKKRNYNGNLIIYKVQCLKP